MMMNPAPFNLTLLVSERSGEVCTNTLLINNKNMFNSGPNFIVMSQDIYYLNYRENTPTEMIKQYVLISIFKDFLLYLFLEYQCIR